jgi:iron-sulfur cluster repair protein YtfE (RIC family)
LFICQRIGRGRTVRAQDVQVIHQHHDEQEKQLRKIENVVDKITSPSPVSNSQQVIDQATAVAIPPITEANSARYK